MDWIAKKDVQHEFWTELYPSGGPIRERVRVVRMEIDRGIETRLLFRVS